MLKKFFYVSLIASAFLTAYIPAFSSEANAESSVSEAAAVNYFKIEVIAGIRYLCEYSDDGLLVNVTELYD